MSHEIRVSPRTGFCFGVSRAIDTLTRAAAQYGGVQTLGAIVHNHQVTEKMVHLGVTVSSNLEEMTGPVVAIGSHGVTPEVETDMRGRFHTVIDTTCPFVKRAQKAAANLAGNGFSVVVYGEADHTEVKGILGYARGKGMAAMEQVSLSDDERRKVGVISQTTQIPERFTEFSKNLLETCMGQDVEMRFIDTICHDMVERQRLAFELAQSVDLMLVVGSGISANTNHLVELCRTVTESWLVEDAKAIDPDSLAPFRCLGVASGASTSNETVGEVVEKLRRLA
jgi:4-hydroxy-3-methylbut-2-en-1-yl diphosphate reductase